MIKNILKKTYYTFEVLLFSLLKNFYNKKYSPVIIISANRSGSSILHHLMSQHPELRSLEKIDKKVEYSNSHVKGWDKPIWRFFDNLNSNHFKRKKDGFIWAHPKYISNIYKENFIFKNYLLYELYKKPSNKRPIIKNHFLPLRIKLIKRIFPNAQFIFNIKNYKDFIKSNMHKNLNDKNYLNAFKENKPDVGLHWLMINVVAQYHLEKYFKDEYVVFKNETLYEKKDLLQKELNKINNFLKISNFDYDLSNVDKKFNFVEDINSETNDLEKIKDISKYERDLN
jgi:hypothetical protein